MISTIQFKPLAGQGIYSTWPAFDRQLNEPSGFNHRQDAFGYLWAFCPSAYRRWGRRQNRRIPSPGCANV